MTVAGALRLAAKNARRNARRTLLTIASVGVSLFLLVSLRTLVTELQGDTLTTKQSGRRLLTRSAVSLQVSLPVSYKEKIAKIDGLEQVSEYQWIPSYYRDPKNLMIIIAADPQFIGTDPEYYISPAEVAAFRSQRDSAVIPKKMMERFGWKLGDRITFQGSALPFDVSLVVRATVTGPSQNAPICRWDYVNELFRRYTPSHADRTMGMILRVKRQEDAAPVSRAVDEMFRNSEVPTRTESEKSFIVGFSSMLGNVTVFLAAISIAVIFAIVLVTTTTMAMAVRERLHELAVLKAIGFQPADLMLLVISESVLISAIGGAAGVGSALLFFRFFDIYKMTNGIVQHFLITRETIVSGAVVALAMGLVSAAFPAWRGVSRPIVATLRDVG